MSKLLIGLLHAVLLCLCLCYEGWVRTVGSSGHKERSRLVPPLSVRVSRQYGSRSECLGQQSHLSDTSDFDRWLNSELEYMETWTTASTKSPEEEIKIFWRGKGVNDTIIESNLVPLAKRYDFWRDVQQLDRHIEIMNYRFYNFNISELVSQNPEILQMEDEEIEGKLKKLGKLIPRLNVQALIDRAPVLLGNDMSMSVITSRYRKLLHLQHKFNMQECVARQPSLLLHDPEDILKRMKQLRKVYPRINVKRILMFSSKSMDEDFFEIVSNCVLDLEYIFENVDAIKIISEIPSILEYDVKNDIQYKVEALKMKYPSLAINSIFLRTPQLMLKTFPLQDIEKRIERIMELFKDDEVVKLLRSCPWMIASDLDRIERQVNLLRSRFGSRTILRLLQKDGHLLLQDMDTVHSIIDMINDVLGLSDDSSTLESVVLHCDELLLANVEDLRATMDYLSTHVFRDDKHRKFILQSIPQVMLIPSNELRNHVQGLQTALNLSLVEVVELYLKEPLLLLIPPEIVRTRMDLLEMQLQEVDLRVIIRQEPRLLMMQDLGTINFRRSILANVTDVSNFASTRNEMSFDPQWLILPLGNYLRLYFIATEKGRKLTLSEMEDYLLLHGLNRLLEEYPDYEKYVHGFLEKSYPSNGSQRKLVTSENLASRRLFGLEEFPVSSESLSIEISGKFSRKRGPSLSLRKRQVNVDL